MTPTPAVEFGMFGDTFKRFEDMLAVGDSMIALLYHVGAKQNVGNAMFVNKGCRVRCRAAHGGPPWDGTIARATGLQPAGTAAVHRLHGELVSGNVCVWVGWGQGSLRAVE